MECPQCETPMQVRPTTTGVELDHCASCGAVRFDRGELLLYLDGARDKRRVAETIAATRSAADDDDPWPEGVLSDDVPFLLERSSGAVFVPGEGIARMRERGQISIAWQPEQTTAPASFALPNLPLRSVATVIALYLGAAVVVALTYEPSSWVMLALASVGVTTGVFLVAPFVLDFLLGLLYGTRAARSDDLPSHLWAFIDEVCAKHRMRRPAMYLIGDGTPTAFTYGWSPSTARIVLSTGLIELLEPKELQAVIGHEIGHARHWDLAIASAADVPVRLLEAAEERLESRKDDSRLAAVVGTLRHASELLVLWLSRTREYHADRFGALAVEDPNALASALIKVGYGLASRNPKGRGRTRPLTAGALGIFDRQTAGTLAITSARPAGGGRFEFSAADVLGAMKWDMWNPWANVYELGSTHPLLAKRLLHLAALAGARGQTPLVRFDLPRPESYWDEFAVDLAIVSLPTVALLGTFVGFFGAGELQLRVPLGTAMLALAAALTIYLLVRYRAPVFPEMSVATLLRQVKVSGIRPIPCRLEGQVRGKGEPGLIWSEDFVLHDDTGMIYLDHRQPFALWEILWGLFSSWKVFGASVIVEGWYRRAPVPYVEVARYWVDGTLRRSWYRHFCWFGVALLAVGGVVLLQWPALQSALGS